MKKRIQSNEVRIDFFFFLNFFVCLILKDTELKEGRILFLLFYFIIFLFESFISI